MEEKEEKSTEEKPVEKDETVETEKQDETQQVENEPVTIELIDQRLQEMTQTIIDTITNLMGTVVQEEKSDDEEKSEDENDWDNLDI
jgi:hypothetical protein